MVTQQPTSVPASTAEVDKPLTFDAEGFLKLAQELDHDPEYQAFIGAYRDGGPSLGGEMTWEAFQEMLDRNVERMSTPEYKEFTRALAAS
jgi:hypothetical protein